MTVLTLRAEALLLDMDGTLVHSTTEVETVWRLWCQSHRLDPEPVLAMCHGVRSYRSKSPCWLLAESTFSPLPVRGRNPAIGGSALCSTFRRLATPGR